MVTSCYQLGGSPLRGFTVQAYRTLLQPVFFFQKPQLPCRPGQGRRRVGGLAPNLTSSHAARRTCILLRMWRGCEPECWRRQYVSGYVPRSSTVAPHPPRQLSWPLECAPAYTHNEAPTTAPKRQHHASCTSRTLNEARANGLPGMPKPRWDFMSTSRTTS